ncbi:MAG: hypothetical protein Q8P63_01820 [Candidatus Nealsonbacteria bacterium]|nr:hypothetical protein [Candidatus Nealsonbacteria bacterium]
MAKEKMVTTRGIYVGILHPKSGKLLLVRRTGSTSIIPDVSFCGNWEIIGGAVMASDNKAVPYNYYLGELSRLMEAKAGIVMVILGLPAMHSVLFKGPNGYDEASVIPIVHDAKPTIGEMLWVSPHELQILTDEFEPVDEKTGKSGKGLLSGYGKRMHCMALAALSHSPNYDFSIEAMRMLREIIPIP